jgi:hypothetical protein
MIRAVATKADGTKLLILGVDDENVKRLTSGQPIHVEGADVGIPGVDVVVMHGHTMQAFSLRGPRAALRGGGATIARENL